MSNVFEREAIEDETRCGPEQYFRQMLEEGRFMIQRCIQTGKAVFYPRAVSPYGGGKLRWEAVSGGGTVYSVTVVRRREDHGGHYNIVLVDLDEGARLMSTVVDVEPTQVHIGMRLQAHIRRQPDGTPRIVFTPAC
jgi:uncharacterized OB-fold protein